jgi:hypothetical protein
MTAVIAFILGRNLWKTRTPRRLSLSVILIPFSSGSTGEVGGHP